MLDVMSLQELCELWTDISKPLSDRSLVEMPYCYTHSDQMNFIDFSYFLKNISSLLILYSDQS